MGIEEEVMASEHTIEEHKSGKRRLLLWFTGTTLLALLIIVGLIYSGLAQPFIWKINNTGRLTVAIIEDYPGNPAAENCRVWVDGKTVKHGASGRFTADFINAGKHTILIKGEKYESRTINFTTRAGINKRLLSVSLSPVEAGRRWMQTKKDNNHKATYEFLHPDERKRIQSAKYVAYKSQVTDALDLKIKAFSVYSPKPLKLWKHPKTGKIYKGVVVMKVDGIISASKIGVVKKKWRIFAQKVDNRWFFLTSL